MSKEDNENFNEEEYHFAIDPDEIERSEQIDFEQAEESTKSKFDFNKFLNVKKIQEFLKENVQVRNAIIVGIVLLLLIITYQFTSGIVSKKKDNQLVQNTIQKPKDFTQRDSNLQSAQSQQMGAKSNTMLQNDFDKEIRSINDSLIKVKESQDIINAKISTLNSENLKMANDYQELTEKLNKLASQIEKLSSAVEDQSQSIMSLSIRREYHPQRVQRQQIVRPQYIKYFVKAVIPGRAWLIAENGSTLTVRKGSVIPGYGVVTIVDVTQGRVLTNSGKIITFGQNDS